MVHHGEIQLPASFSLKYRVMEGLAADALVHAQALLFILLVAIDVRCRLTVCCWSALCV